MLRPLLYATLQDIRNHFNAGAPHGFHLVLPRHRRRSRWPDVYQKIFPKQPLSPPHALSLIHIFISAGPLASESLSASIARAVGAEHLYFYDAIAPIVAADSIDMGIAFWGSRYGEPGEGDYLNCPMNLSLIHI